MTKKKSKKKISKKQKSMKEGFTQAKEEQEKENPQKYDPAQKTGQDRVSDPVEPEIQRLAAEKQQPLQATSKIRTTVSAARQPLISLWQN